MKYSIIYADCPWQYENKKTGGTMVSGAESKYPTMSVVELSELPVKSLSLPDSVLFMWATTPLKREAFQVMDAWGFKYKTTIYWEKTGINGMGFWLRGRVEELYVCVRGRVKPFRLQEPNIIQSKVLRHSEKPEEFRSLIERATRNMPIQTRLEMFARRRAPGWDAFGNQVEGSIEIGESR